MIGDNLYPLRVLLVVAQTGHATRAAEHLGISQPAVSAHIHGLEKQCGERLFLRGRKGMKLTPFGEAIVQQARAVFAEVDELKALVAGTGSLQPVRLAVSSTPGVHWLPARLREFSQVHPGLKVSYALSDSAEALSAVLSGFAPLAVVGDLPLVSSNRSLHCKEIGRDRLQLMASSEHRLARRKQLRPEDLRGETLILREPGSSTRAQSEALLAPLLQHFAQVLELNRGEAIKEAVIAGLGVGVLSSWAVARELHSGHLCPLAPSRWSQSRPIYLVRQAERRLRGPGALVWSFLERSGATPP